MSEQAVHVATLLKNLDLKLVLAESCTGGMASALLTQIPGISDCFCGSAVTYRQLTKIEWLTISDELLQSYSAESQQTSDAMALLVLQNTTEANIGASITGHLGPNVDPNQDGKIFVTVAVRQHSSSSRSNRLPETDATVILLSREYQLSTTSRTSRQLEAADALLKAIVDCLTT